MRHHVRFRFLPLNEPCSVLNAIESEHALYAQFNFFPYLRNPINVAILVAPSAPSKWVKVTYFQTDPRRDFVVKVLAPLIVKFLESPLKFSSQQISFFCYRILFIRIICLDSVLIDCFSLFFADIPAAVSLPHFYKADSKLLNSIDGLKPNHTLHSTSLAIQPVSMEQNHREQQNPTPFKFNASKFNFVIHGSVFRSSLICVVLPALSACFVLDVQTESWCTTCRPHSSAN